MGKSSEKNQLKEMRDFLSERKLISELARRAGVGVRTVYDTFGQKSEKDLKFKQITVYKTAIEMINEVKQLPELAKKALS
jgi:DNA-binding phage protein